MNAEDAKKLALGHGAGNDIVLRPGPGEATRTTPESLFQMIWAATLDHIQARCKAGKTNLWVEPFTNIPGALLKEGIDEEAMDLLVNQLHDDHYADIEWDRRQGRIVLKFTW